MKSVCIRACEQRTQPLTTKGWDAVWAVNNAHAAYEFKPDLIIAMDDLQRDWDSGHHELYVTAIVNAGVPVYSARSHKQWPSVEPYPLKKVLKSLKMSRNEWWLFDNTVNYSIALALALGYQRIGLFGCEFVQPYNHTDLLTENFRWKLKGYDCPDWFAYHARSTVWSRAPAEPGYESLHWWIGYAQAKGFNIALPKTDSAICNLDRVPHFYGYQEQPDI